MASIDMSQSIKNKIQIISSKLNNEILKWYIKNGFKNDLNDFRPGFISEEEYTEFIECFEILQKNQTEIETKIENDKLLYNLIIYYYLLVIVEHYVLEYSCDFNSFKNIDTQEWMYSFSINQTKWASEIRRKLMHFNNENFDTFHIPRFNPFKKIHK